MQKIFYLSEISLPNTSAQVIQILKMCDSFSDKKKEVYLLVNHNENLKFYNLKKKYNLKTNFKIISLKNNKNLSFINNSNDEIENSVINFLKSLKNNNWKNYGKKFLIKERNYDFHGIKKNLNEKILLKRRTVFFDPYFAKKYKDNYLK